VSDSPFHREVPGIQGAIANTASSCPAWPIRPYLRLLNFDWHLPPARFDFILLRTPQAQPAAHTGIIGFPQSAH
jgi:hypothetical protein